MSEAWWNSVGEEIGSVPVPSGQLMVCDPGTLFAPVKVEIPAGTYAVRILVDDEEDRPREAALVLGEGTVDRWEEVGWYGVDCGLSGFFDAEHLKQVEEAEYEISIYDDLIGPVLEQAEANGEAGTVVPSGEGAFSTCTSGWGDGTYVVRVGRSADGRPLVVLTVFMDEEEES